MSSVADATVVIAQRRRHQRKKKIVRWLIVLLVLALVATAGWLVGWSQVFALKTVDVTGTRLLTAEQVTGAARPPLGQPLIRVSERPIAERVAALPQVRSVTVTRHAPNTLEIAVTEREAAFARPLDGKWQLCDDAGVGFVEVDAKPEGLVEVRTEVDDPKVLSEVAGAMLAMPEDVRNQVQYAEVKSRDSVQLVLNGDKFLFYGSGEQGRAKGEVASSLLKAVPDATYYDVSAPGNPTTR